MTAFPYENPVEPHSVGLDPHRLGDVVARFKNQQVSDAFPGGQLVLRRNGSLVLNEAVGIARGFRSGESISPMLVRPPTPFPVLQWVSPVDKALKPSLQERPIRKNYSLSPAI